MKNYIALIVASPSEVTFSSNDSHPVLHRVDVSQNPPNGPIRAISQVFDGQTKCPLVPGLYVVAALNGIACGVKSGDVTVVVLGGEDPWPVPPAKLLAILKSYPGSLVGPLHKKI